MKANLLTMDGPDYFYTIRSWLFGAGEPRAFSVLFRVDWYVDFLIVNIVNRCIKQQKCVQGHCRNCYKCFPILKLKLI